MSKKLELTGHRFGKLLVQERDHSKTNVTWWIVQCDCGQKNSVRGVCLKRGDTKSCGCVKSKTTEFGESAKKALYQMVRITAERRRIIFDIAFDEFIKITTKPCHYCGIEWSSEYPKTIYKKDGSKPELAGRLKLNGTYKHNGIDRMDSKQGYISGNCLPCCKICNIAKHTMSMGEFKDWIIKVNSHYVKGQTQHGIPAGKT